MLDWKANVNMRSKRVRWLALIYGLILPLGQPRQSQDPTVHAATPEQRSGVSSTIHGDISYLAYHRDSQEELGQDADIQKQVSSSSCWN